MHMCETCCDDAEFAQTLLWQYHLSQEESDALKAQLQQHQVQLQQAEERRDKAVSLLKDLTEKYADLPNTPATNTRPSKTPTKVISQADTLANATLHPSPGTLFPTLTQTLGDTGYGLTLGGTLGHGGATATPGLAAAPLGSASKRRGSMLSGPEAAALDFLAQQEQEAAARLASGALADTTTAAEAGLLGVTAVGGVGNGGGQPGAVAGTGPGASSPATNTEDLPVINPDDIGRPRKVTARGRGRARGRAAAGRATKIG